MTYQFLIVDDEYFVRQRIRLCIPWKEYGFECAGEAANVDQALRFLEATPVDLVILDISMPGANGLELLRMMKEQNSQIKFIINDLNRTRFRWITTNITCLLYTSPSPRDTR